MSGGTEIVGAIRGGERHIDAATWVDLTANPKQSIGIGGGEQVTSRTHVLTAERNVVTGKTTWAMIKRP